LISFLKKENDSIFALF